MNTHLIEIWTVKSFDMVSGKSVTSIGGLPGEPVEFTPDGHFLVDVDHSDNRGCRYRALETDGLSALDIWIGGMHTLVTHCIYTVADDVLAICIAGDYGERPTELRWDDDKLWCVKTLERSYLLKKPQARRKRKL